MKVTLFTSNNDRHNYLINLLSNFCDELWVVQERKTLFTGKYVGKDNFGNKYYKNKDDKRWVIYANNIEATKISSDWYLWMHHTIDKLPDTKELKKYSWEKDHQENLTGTSIVTLVLSLTLKKSTCSSWSVTGF